jgi:hypothetical protein
MIIKDLIIKLIFSILVVWYGWYIGYLLYQRYLFVIPQFIPYIYIVAIILIILIFIVGLHTSFLQYHLTTKLKLFFVCCGILFITIAHYILLDDPIKHIYLRDITILMGTFIIIAGASGICISAQTIKKIEDQKIEIIEV